MTEQTNFQSDEITFTLLRQPDCIAEYHAKSSAEIVKSAKQEAIKQLSKEVSIPGFRKGRAPDHLIVKKFPQALEEKWEKLLASHAFHACQKISSTQTLDEKTEVKYDLKSYSESEGAELIFTFETEPLVPDLNESSLELEEVKREVIDEKTIASRLHEIQMFFAHWESITDRPVQMGDYVHIDLETIEEPQPQKVFDNARFEVQKSKLAKWMLDLLMGMQIGETKEGVSQVDEAASAEEKEKTPPKKVRLHLKSIDLPILPPVDDALAKKVGAKNAEEMKQNLTALLNKHADHDVREHYRAQMQDHLLKNCPIDLPKSLIQREVEFRFRQLMKDPEFNHNFSKRPDVEALVKEIAQQSERALKLFFISKKIIKDHQITVSTHDLPKATEHLHLEALLGYPHNAYGAKADSKEQEIQTLSRLLIEKAEDFLISKSKIVPPQQALPSSEQKEQKPKEKKQEKKEPNNQAEQKPKEKKASPPKKKSSKKT